MMRNSRWQKLLQQAVFTGILAGLLLSCSKNAYEGMAVVVEVKENSQGSYEGAKLLGIDIQNPEKSARVLSADFESAAAPAITYDGRYLCFQAKKEGDKAWQIWVTDLQNNKTTRVTDLPENCIQPTPLPDGTIIFSREGTVKGRLVYDLYRCQRDGTAMTRITYTPALNIHASVLQEGRVLYSTSEQYPERSIPSLMVMRPDGAKSEIYCPGSPDSFPVSAGSESSEGYIYYIDNRMQLNRVLHKRPLHTRESLSAGLSGGFSGVYPLTGSENLVTYRSSDDENFALYTFDANTREAPVLIYKASGTITDPVLVVAMEKRPMKLPSAIDPHNPTSLLMAQDINHSMMPVNKGVTGDTVADRIRVSTLEGELAVVEVKEDGSFYLKLDAETPLRFETLNNLGETVRGPSDWIYLRSNERRACVGCHADPELAPVNLQPLAVKEDPVVLVAKLKETSN